MNKAEDPGRPDEDAMGARSVLLSLAPMQVQQRALEGAEADVEQLDWIEGVLSELEGFAAVRGDEVLTNRVQAALRAFVVERVQ